ncbi:ssDNA-binding replication factor A, large subunit [Candidatus Methanophagaceae archaeon]|nr:ssDNA-binding replication factor A, large subunit [Methanophagales archaeon]
MKMDYLPSTEGILKRILGSGYQIHPDALKVLESLGEEKAIAVLGTFPEKFPELIVIEVKHVERFMEKAPVKTVTETNESNRSGKITQIYDGSGLIQRCPKCDRWIIDNFCIVHSDVEGIWDLRIKARFDNGKVRCTLIFKKDATEKSVGITLEEAKKLGEVATLERIKEALVGKNIEVAGVKLSGGNFLVKDIRRV